MSAEQLNPVAAKPGTARKPGTNQNGELTRDQLETWPVGRLQRWGTLPFCHDCGKHIGSGASKGQRCGACAVLKARAVLDARLTFGELKRFVRLVRKHWGDGKPRRLLLGAGDYRPTLITAAHPRLMESWSAQEREQELATCAERAELADLYDRMQASRGDVRRACRS